MAQFDILIPKLRANSAAIQESIKRYGYGATFMLLPADWKKYADEVAHINLNWNFVKYSKFKDVPTVADNTPGIYLFVLKPPHDVFEYYSFVMYVGMTVEGLKERLKKGYRTPSQAKSRQNIMRLILDYGRNLYWYYTPIADLTKDQIHEIETSLIGYFGEPPINVRDKPTIIAEATKSKMT